MKKRIVILGTNGFIGNWLLKRFSSDQQFSVTGFNAQECNLLSPASTKDALSDLNRNDILIMAAAITRLKDNSLEAMMKNIQMVENLIRVISERPVHQFIYLSSVDVYGCLERKFIKKNQRITEQFELKPDDYYGVGKVACEFLLRNQLGDKKIALSILRLPGVFGPGDETKSLIGRFIQSITEEGKVCIYDNGEDRRDYLYIEDVYTTVRKCIEHRLNDIVNVVSGKNYSIREIVDLIKKTLDSSCQVEFKEAIDHENERIKNMQFDPEHLLAVLPDLKIHDLFWGIKCYWGQWEYSKVNE